MLISKLGLHTCTISLNLIIVYAYVMIRFKSLEMIESYLQSINIYIFYNLKMVSYSIP